MASLARFRSPLALLALLAGCPRTPFSLDLDASAVQGSGGRADAGAAAGDDAGEPVAHDAAAHPTDDGGEAHCADGDGDRVCDLDDNCVDVGNPAQADADGDGQGDACDDPCDAEAPSTALETTRFAVREVSIDGGGAIVTVEPGARLTLAFSYDLAFCTPGAPTLNQQIMLGFDDGSAPACAVHGLCAPAMGVAEQAIIAPTTRGVYYVLADVAQQMQCVERWEGSMPDASQRIAVVCVR